MRESAENTIKNNYIHDLPTYFKQDGGAIYFGIGQRPHYRGNLVEGNYLADVPSNGVYIDNFSSGTLVKNNVFNNVGNKRFNFAGIDINGGQNVMESNLFFNNQRPIKCNRFAEKSLFNNYYGNMSDVHEVFNEFGVENTALKDYPDFIDFLNYDTESDFNYQISNPKDNLSYNDSVTFDNDVIETGGVVVRDCERWVVENNDIIDLTKPVFSLSGILSQQSLL